MNRLANMIFWVCLIILPIQGYARNTTAEALSRHHPCPPPEAYEVCEDKSPGDTAQIEGPYGEIISGSCEQMGQRLVLRPTPPKTDFVGEHHAPPPKAFTACQDKEAGDTAQLVTPCGDTVTGTCEWEGDRLVLHPDHPEFDTDDMDSPAGDAVDGDTVNGDTDSTGTNVF